MPSVAMAFRSLYFSVSRRCRIDGGIRSNRVSGRFLSSEGLRNLAAEEEEEESNTNVSGGCGSGGDDLKSRVFRLRLPKRSATNILDRWISEGKTVTASELRHISKELCNSQRYKHALEISEWMVCHQEFELSDSDCAIRIDLLTKVFGINAAERYFQGLPLAAKTTEVYTALLHSYAGAKLVEKAEQLYDGLKGSNLSFTALMYNEMMTLYMSIGQAEKVPSVVEEMKCKKVVPDIFTYNLWISSCASSLNMDQVQRILTEMSHVCGSKNEWTRYINIAKIYITAGRLVCSEPSAVVDAERSISQREWITYDFLIILYASLGNKDRIDQIWKSLRMMNQKMTSRSFICVLSSYLMLGHFTEAGDVVDQWMQCSTTDFDISACDRLLKAFCALGFTEIANHFHMLLIQRNCDPTKLSE